MTAWRVRDTDHGETFDDFKRSSAKRFEGLDLTRAEQFDDLKQITARQLRNLESAINKRFDAMDFDLKCIKDDLQKLKEDEYATWRELAWVTLAVFSAIVAFFN